jgi:hypothetical protein
VQFPLADLESLGLLMYLMHGLVMLFSISSSELFVTKFHVIFLLLLS